MSRYPAIDGADSSVNSLVAHTDSGFMTLLPPNKVLGLEINLPDGAVSASPPPAFGFESGAVELDEVMELPAAAATPATPSQEIWESHGWNEFDGSGFNPWAGGWRK